MSQDFINEVRKKLIEAQQALFEATITLQEVNRTMLNYTESVLVNMELLEDKESDIDKARLLVNNPKIPLNTKIFLEGIISFYDTKGNISANQKEYLGSTIRSYTKLLHN